MADVILRTVSAVITATTGNTQTITIPAAFGGGLPKAALVTCSFTAPDSTRLGNLQSYGITDGITQTCTSTGSVNAGTASDVYTDWRSDLISGYTNDTTTTLFGAAEFTQFVPDGIQITVTADFPVGAEAHFTLIGGADVTARRETVSLTTNEEVVNLGYEPDLMFINTGVDITPAHSGICNQSFGVVQNIAGVAKNYSQSSFGRAGRITMENRGWLSDVYAMTRWSGTSFQTQLSLHTFTSTGFSVTTVGTVRSFSTLTLEFASQPDIELWHETIPISGDWTVTQPGFEPTWGLVAGMNIQSTFNDDSTTNRYGISLSMFDASVLGCISVSDRDAAGTSQTDSSSTSYMQEMKEDSLEGIYRTSTGHALTADGWTISGLSQPESTSLGYAICLAIGPGAAVTFDGPNIVPQTGTENALYTFDENAEGTVASRFTGATTYALAPGSDALPTGLTVNPTTGNIEGTPTEVATRNITIRGSE